METTTKSVKRKKRKFKITKRELKRRIKIGLHKAEADGRFAGRPEYAKRAEILELRAAGKKYMEICQILGCAKSTVWRAIALERESA